MGQLLKFNTENEDQRWIKTLALSMLDKGEITQMMNSVKQITVLENKLL